MAPLSVVPPFDEVEDRRPRCGGRLERAAVDELTPREQSPTDLIEGADARLGAAGAEGARRVMTTLIRVVK